MAFKFQFQRTKGTVPVEQIREAVKASLRDLSKALKALGDEHGISIHLWADVNTKDGDEAP